MPQVKVSLEYGEWIYLLYALDTKVEQLSALPEPLRSQQVTPFLEIRKKVMLLIEQYEKK